MEEVMYPRDLDVSKLDTHVYITSCVTDYAKVHNEQRNHRHGFYSIELITDGETIQHINEEEYKCSRGTVAFLSPFDAHRYTDFDILSLEYLCFNEEILFPDVWENIDIDNFPYVSNLSQEDFDELFCDIEMLKREEAKNDEFSQSITKGIVNKIVAVILRCAHKQKTDKKNRDIKEAISYIRYHFREPITLEKIADRLHVTPSYFCRCFKKYAKTTFKEYVTALRLDYAMRQIKSTDKSITEICFESGFSTSAYFSKVFTRRFGKNPSEYRKIL